jgi:hypothetical protein
MVDIKYTHKNYKDFLTLMIRKILQLIIDLSTIRIIIEFLSEDQVGVYYVLLTTISLLAFGFFNPLGQFYSRHLVHWKETKNIKNATVTMLWLRFMASLDAVEYLDKHGLSVGNHQVDLCSEIANLGKVIKSLGDSNEKN